MRIDPAPFVGPNHPCPQTGQVQGGKGQEEPGGVRGRQGWRGDWSEAGSHPICASRKVSRVLETQAVLVQGLGIGGLITHHEPGIIRLVNEGSQS